LIKRENVTRSFDDTSKDTNKSLEIATMLAGQTLGDGRPEILTEIRGGVERQVAALEADGDEKASGDAP
jgi:hypothetical protein